MASQNRPSSAERAPNTATTYERAEPKREAGLGDLDNMAAGATPVDHPDKMEHAAQHGGQITRPPDEDINDGNGSRSRTPSQTEKSAASAEGDLRPQQKPGSSKEAPGQR